MKVLSANCRGIQDLKKRTDVITYLKDKNPNIICLQDTHLTKQNLASLKRVWGFECLINGNKTNSRGVAVLLNNNFEYNIERTQVDTEGNLLVLDIKLPSFTLKLINIYGPNIDSPDFFVNIGEILEISTQDYIIVCGDLNLALNQNLDTLNYRHINNPRSKEKLVDIMNNHDLIDIFRFLNPTTKKYTWQQKTFNKKARLDYFIISSTMSNIIQSCTIKPGYRSDHSIIELSIILNTFERGRGTFKLNCKLLKNTDYLNLVNTVIDEEKLKYAVPLYNIENMLNIPDEDFQYIINDGLFYEMIMQRIRGETIKFSSRLKKEENKREKKLIEEIENLNNVSNDNDNQLSEKNKELQELRKIKLEGAMVRSKLEWLSHGEKPTRYFCSLERKNFIDKTVQKLTKNTGEVIYDQKIILHEIKTFYSKLFANRDDDIANINLEEKFKNINYNKLDPQSASHMEGKFKLEEISNALKKMKNNKSPGLDGFPAEFFKVFWNKLRIIVLRAINYSFDSKILPISLRRCIINCLPKGDKPRDNMKNWRPISLLSVTYKIASAALSNRIKPFLDKIISKTQSGFIKGRFIGDTTRLIYDIMDFTENNNIPGLLVLIDFEKAFDSISWKFMYNVLEFMGFGRDFIQWIKIFNSDITAYIIQSGYLSDPLNIERGCRQGDPISVYMFLLCAQILFLLIDINKNIVGIKIGSQEYKLSQFADDTTMLLDGSRRSLEAALNTLEVFGSMSGLKVNTEKTKLVWMGRMKHSKDKIDVGVNLEWGSTKFTLLGVHYSVNLKEMIKLNFELCNLKIKKILKSWSSRDLTPIGRISVVKTFIISKYNHLFQTLPSAGDDFMKNLIRDLYTFIWGEKPDRINRNQVVQDYLNGGLKMVNIENFVLAQKTSWIRRLLINQGPLWVNLFEDTICEVKKLLLLGNLWPVTLAGQVKNEFWKDTLQSWTTVLKKISFDKNKSPWCEPLWYNPLISNGKLFYAYLYEKGIHVIGDIIDRDNKILSLDTIKHKFSIPNLNFLHYFRIKLEVLNYLKNITNPVETYMVYPYIPKYYAILYKNGASSKDLYRLLNEKLKIKKDYQTKWNDKLNLEQNNDNYWSRIFKACFKSVEDPYLKWFQYRIIHKVLGTRYLLGQMGIANSVNCYFCKNSAETISHLFDECPLVSNLWADFQNWIYDKIHYRLFLNSEIKILGYIGYGKDFLPINCLLVSTRNYIFSCSRNQTIPIIRNLIEKCKDIFVEQEYVAKTMGKIECFRACWAFWSPIFT